MEPDSLFLPITIPRQRGDLMQFVRSLIAGSLFLAALPLFAQGSANTVEANKKVVHDFYRFIWEPRDLTLLDKYTTAAYIEHNPNFNGLRADLVAALKSGKLGDWS